MSDGSAGATAETAPKQVCQTSVEELLDNVNDFIRNVYNDIGLLSPSTPATSSRVRNNHRHFSPQSSPMPSSNTSLNSSSESELNRNIPGSPSVRQNRHNLDAEIARINIISDNVDHNLRSIGVYVNGRRGDGSAAGTNTVEFTPSRRRTNVSPANADIASVVDLSESQTETPEVLRTQSSLQQANHFNQGDDDDEVVVVSSYIPQVIDLCTPVHEGTSRYSAVQRNLLSRRVLDEASQPEEVPARRRRVSSANTNRKEFTPAPDHTPSDDDNGKDNSSGRDPFMCPVCMDSCLGHRPTSTKCGHVYCEQCIKQALRLTRKCPLCNTKLSDKQLILIYL